MSTNARQMARQLIAQQRFGEARELLLRVCRVTPDDADAWLMLGSIDGRLRDPVGAERCFRRAIKVRAEFPAAHYNLGIALRDQKRFDEAAKVFRLATELKPDYSEAWNALGFALLVLREPVAAADAFRTVCHLAPNSAEAHGNFANACNQLGRLEEAMAAFRKAISLDGRESGYRGNLANVLCNQGRLGEALDEYRRAIALAPRNISLQSNYLLTLHYLPDLDPQWVFEEHRRLAAMHVPADSTVPEHNNDPKPDRRLRVGYVSSDFREHSVAYFFDPLITHHDCFQIETFCYSGVARPDSITTRLEAVTKHWRGICDKSDADLFRMIRSDGIDILVDLSGHTSCHRLAVFARRAAPVQVTYLGYPGTTGLETMDYRLTDEWADPDGMTERYYTEQLWRLPTGFLCYKAPRTAPAPALCPSASSGYITFGSFNNLSKVNDRVIALWSRILQSVPQSRLALKYHSMGDASVRALVFERFRQHNIAEERLELLPPVPTTAGHLECYGRIDIALDPFPYNGTTTTCEALWMGVPVVSLAGAIHAQRVGVSLLSRAGLSDWVADSEQTYLDIAVTLAAAHEERARLRTALRQTLESSSLCDGRRIAAAVEDAYRKMWQEWCKTRTA